MTTAEARQIIAAGWIKSYVPSSSQVRRAASTAPTRRVCGAFANVDPTASAAVTLPQIPYFSVYLAPLESSTEKEDTDSGAAMNCVHHTHDKSF